MSTCAGDDRHVSASADPRDRDTASPEAVEPLFACTWSPSQAGTAWVWPTGELDLATVPALDAALTAAFSDARSVVLDLRRLSFLDSAGVRHIVGAGAGASRAGQRLMLIPGRPHVQRVFALTGTADAVEIIDPSHHLTDGRRERVS